MKRELYKVDQHSYIPVLTHKDPPVDLVIRRLSPSIVGLKDALIWNVACLGRVKVYCLYDRNVLIHRSFVVRGKAIFPFLNKGDIEIGPCWTDSMYRGRGYYPYVISQIITSELVGGHCIYDS